MLCCGGRWSKTDDMRGVKTQIKGGKSVMKMLVQE